MAEKELQRLKFPTRTIETVTYLVSIHDRAIPDNKPALKRYLREMGEENFLRFLKIRRADRGALAEGYRDISDSLNRALTLLEQIKIEKECYTLSSLAVSGEEIQSVFSESEQERDALFLARYSDNTRKTLYILLLDQIGSSRRGTGPFPLLHL